MKQKDITAYFCDFCNRLFQRKGACSNHENNHCRSNPKNRDACIDCKHCEKIDIEMVVDGYNGYFHVDRVIKTSHFKCNKFDKLMYPFKAEKWAEKYPHDFDEQERMPSVEQGCEGFEHQWEITKVKAIPKDLSLDDIF